MTDKQPYRVTAGDRVRWKDSEWIGTVKEPLSGVLAGWWTVLWHEPEQFIGSHAGSDLIWTPVQSGAEVPRG